MLHTFARERADRWRLIVLAALGYLAAWVAVGAVLGPVVLGVQAITVSPLQGASMDRLVMPALLLVLGLVMAVEKNVRWGRRLSAPVGVALIVGAGVVFMTGGAFGQLAKTIPELCGAG